MFTVSFADKNCFIPRTKYLEQPRQTKKEEQMRTVQGWKKLYTGVQGWVEVVVEEGGAGWIWVPPTPHPPSNPHQAGLRSRLPLPTYLALQLTLENKAKDERKGVIKAWDDNIAGKKSDSAHPKKT